MRIFTIEYGLITGMNHADYKGNKIWTIFIIHADDTPKFMISGKLDTAIATAPYPDKWIVHTDRTGEYYEARYPSEDLIEHMSTITQLTDLRMNDKMSLSYLSVVDARIEVIGTSIPDDAPIPIIGMKEIMGEKCFTERLEMVYLTLANPYVEILFTGGFLLVKLTPAQNENTHIRVCTASRQMVMLTTVYALCIFAASSPYSSWRAIHSKK